MTEFIMLADLPAPNDPQGRTYRQVNAAKTHAIPLGTLVEVSADDADDPYNGIRLRVIRHDRDCDMTPLYALGIVGPAYIVTGFSEESLTIMKENA